MKTIICLIVTLSVVSTVQAVDVPVQDIVELPKMSEMEALQQYQKETFQMMSVLMKELPTKELYNLVTIHQGEVQWRLAEEYAKRKDSLSAEKLLESYLTEKYEVGNALKMKCGVLKILSYHSGAQPQHFVKMTKATSSEKIVAVLKESLRLHLLLMKTDSKVLLPLLDELKTEHKVQAAVAEVLASRDDADLSVLWAKLVEYEQLGSPVVAIMLLNRNDLNVAQYATIASILEERMNELEEKR